MKDINDILKHPTLDKLTHTHTHSHTPCKILKADREGVNAHYIQWTKDLYDCKLLFKNYTSQKIIE